MEAEIRALEMVIAALRGGQIKKDDRASILFHLEVMLRRKTAVKIGAGR